MFRLVLDEPSYQTYIHISINKSNKFISCYLHFARLFVCLWRTRWGVWALKINNLMVIYAVRFIWIHFVMNWCWCVCVCCVSRWGGKTNCTNALEQCTKERHGLQLRELLTSLLHHYVPVCEDWFSNCSVHTISFAWCTDIFIEMSLN